VKERRGERVKRRKGEGVNGTRCLVLTIVIMGAQQLIQASTNLKGL
jgi:hypothetical protein